MSDAIKCPDCGDDSHLYVSGDFKWNPDERKWELDAFDERGDCECTTCDWSGYANELGDTEDPSA